MPILTSAEDASVNFLFPAEKGIFEARYVRRENRYLAIYLSTQSGCKQACRFCHLTATGQTDVVDATCMDILVQAFQVFEHYDKLCTAPAEIAHFNFMARGEPLESKAIRVDNRELFGQLAESALSRGLRPKFLISTILPATLEKPLEDIFPVITPEIYYSLYSTDPEFRKRWLPKALPVEQALQVLKSWQRNTGKIPKIHYALIEGENDSKADTDLICDAIQDAGLIVNFNLVRYNPYSPKHGTEPKPSVLRERMHQLKERFPQARVKLIDRVGFDVKASCGMFVQQQDYYVPQEIFGAR